MTGQELLVDCLRRLNAAGLAYMLTGSMVSNYWGIPRTTHDLDFVIQLPPAAVPKLVEEFRPDFFLQEDAIRAAYQPPHQFDALHTRSALKVDFWLLKPEPFERAMFARRAQVTLFGQPAWIATAEDVILHEFYWNKLSPPDRQLSDVAGVVAVQGERLDREYLKRWAGELQVNAALADALTGRTRPKQT